MADVLQDSDDLFTLDTIFSIESQQILGTLLVLPTKGFMSVMVGYAKETVGARSDSAYSGVRLT